MVTTFGKATLERQTQLQMTSGNKAHGGFNQTTLIQSKGKKLNDFQKHLSHEQ
jgi:hypothetical protein